MPQEPGDGTANVSDCQVIVVGADGSGVAGASGVVGDRTLVLLSTAQAVAKVEAAASVANSKRILFMIFVGGTGPPASMDYKLVCACTELCVQHPAILGNRRISATTSDRVQKPGHVILKRFVCAAERQIIPWNG